MAGLWLDHCSSPITSYFFRRFMIAFNDSSDDALPFLRLCKPLPLSKRSSKTVKQIVFLTYIKPSRSMDHTPLQVPALTSKGLHPLAPLWTWFYPVSPLICSLHFPRFQKQAPYYPALGPLHLGRPLPRKFFPHIFKSCHSGNLCREDFPVHPILQFSPSPPKTLSVSGNYYFHGIYHYLKSPFPFLQKPLFHLFIHSLLVPPH